MFPVRKQKIEVEFFKFIHFELETNILAIGCIFVTMSI